MTAAEMLIEEGRKKGLKEGHREGHYEAKREAAFNMFSRNCDLDFVADVQSLTAEQVLTQSRMGSFTRTLIVLIGTNRPNPSQQTF